MAQKRVEVRMIREILRLHSECGYSDKRISQICGKSLPTVKVIYSAIKQTSYFWPLPATLDNAGLEQIVYPRKTYSRAWPVPDWNYTWKQKQRKGVTLKLLPLRYKSKQEDAYQYKPVLQELREMVWYKKSPHVYR